MLITFANLFMHTGIEEGNIQENIFIERSLGTTRTENCITQIRTFFPDVGDDMLIAHYIDPETKESIRDMFKGLKDQFRNIIRENDWMGKRTKLRAEEKLKGTTTSIGELSPNTPEFEELKAKMSHDYIGNILTIGNYLWDTRVNSLLKDKNIFKGKESSTNAFYTPLLNKVAIKTGLINEILGLGFSLNYPISILYGGFVASTLGHELTHGFDSTGRMYDKDGFHLDWWETQDDKAFNNRTSCLVNQYDNFKISHNGTEFGIELDELSLKDPRENIADNGGVKVAYRAFQEIVDKEECIAELPFSAKQLFWIGYAMDYCAIGETIYDSYEDMLLSTLDDEGHSPIPWRVNVPLSNMPEFAQDFKCSIEDKLNPKEEERCGVW